MRVCASRPFGAPRGLPGSEIKTNNQKSETKDEPQTNGSYKIRLIIIKIMEYTPKSKIETVQKRKVQ